ncbi:MAG: coenzyme F420-0:L-glutamate ligase [Acholeplasma sp.]|nr:coenzyme F420-0:L-glutamate ligase [Acholeplasma sp.]
MSKSTVVRAIKTPIIKAHDDLAMIVVNAILASSKNDNFSLNDRDVIGITEAVVSISANNYATLDNIAKDINNKFKSDHLGIVFPILSRNRYSILLRAFARAKKELTILLSYPFDEVGNGILQEERLRELKINPYSDTFTEEEYSTNFGDYKHPYTGVNMVNYYKEISHKENAKVNFVFSNHANDIKKYTKDVLVSNIHARHKTKEQLKEDKELVVYGLDDILTSPIDKSGFNSKYGLLGTNAATDKKVKLFPNDSKELLKRIQDELLDRTGKKVEVMIYGDGAFKDPANGIWELADPVVSPSYTKGLEGSPNEIKLKYLIDNEFKDLKGEELEEAVRKKISEKKSSLVGQDISLGTTPRAYVNLLGSLCDLVSGSGDKGTPVILIQNYF